MIYGGKEGSSSAYVDVDLRPELIKWPTALTTKNAIKRGDLDIIKPEWIVECIAQGTLVELRKRYELSISAMNNL